MQKPTSVSQQIWCSKLLDFSNFPSGRSQFAITCRNLRWNNHKKHFSGTPFKRHFRWWIRLSILPSGFLSFYLGNTWNYCLQREFCIIAANSVLLELWSAFKDRETIDFLSFLSWVIFSWATCMSQTCVTTNWNKWHTHSCFYSP